MLLVLGSMCCVDAIRFCCYIVLRYVYTKNYMHYKGYLYGAAT